MEQVLAILIGGLIVTEIIRAYLSFGLLKLQKERNGLVECGLNIEGRTKELNETIDLLETRKSDIESFDKVVTERWLKLVEKEESLGKKTPKKKA